MCAHGRDAICRIILMFLLLLPLANGNWCAPAEALRPQNGNIQYPPGYMYPYSKVYFSCNPGCNLVGPSVLTCLPSLAWDNQPPKCYCHGHGGGSGPVGQCPFPEPFDHGSFTFDASRPGGIQPGHKVKFECHPGCVLSGNAALTCTHRFTYDFPLPTCNCDGGRGTVPITRTCPPVMDPVNGRALPRNQRIRVGYIVRFSCNRGYEMTGCNSIVCTYAGTYNSPSPICTKRKRTQCPEPEAPANGNVNPDGRPVVPGVKLTFWCNRGYTIAGNSIVECTKSGAYDSEFPTCHITCRPPSAPENGNVSPNDHMIRLGGKVRFTCNSGYKLIGSAIITCTGPDVYDSQSPTCTPITCRPPSAPTNGKVSPSDHPIRLDGKVHFACNAGYELIGPTTITCTGDNVYDSPSPTCTPRNRTLCPEPEAPANGNVNPDGRPVVPGVKLTFRCNREYIIMGNSIVECTKSGAYDSEFPTCRKKCPPPQVPRNGGAVIQGDNGVNVTYECAPGYGVFGKMFLKCKNGTFDHPFPKCHIKCKPFNIPHGKIIYDTSKYDELVAGVAIEVECDPEYRFDEGSVVNVCNNVTGSWSERHALCIQ